MAAGADETFTSDAQKFYEGELHKSITDAFNAFANEGKNTVDVRRIGPIIRSLGCFPTETELHSLLAEMEDEEPTGYIELETFLPVMTKMIKDGRYKPIPGDAILAAFQVLDQDDKGYLTPEELIHYMMQAVAHIFHRGADMLTRNLFGFLLFRLIAATEEGVTTESRQQYSQGGDRVREKRFSSHQGMPFQSTSSPHHGGIERIFVLSHGHP
uniref:EF-hand calcium binding domain 2 n=1 Tax=Eptatretus burgeri TaxID=7764 RepID=A0A8C4Q3J0_EPTBU